MRRALTVAASAGRPARAQPPRGLRAPRRRTARWSPRATTAEPARRTPRSTRSPTLAARGGPRRPTAVVTLEPCNHTGRTGPCSEALLAAGVRAGGARPVRRRPGLDRGSGPAARRRCRGRRRSAGRRGARPQPGLDVLGRARPPLRDLEARHVPRRAQRRGRRHLPLDQQRRRRARDTHALRGRSDVVHGRHRHRAGRRPAPHRARRRRHRPARASGSRCGRSWGCATCRPTGACSTTRPRPSTCAPATPTRRWPTCTRAAATTSSSRAGPHLAGAFLEAGLVDEVIAYVAPVLVGGGTHTVEGLDVPTLAAAHRLDVVDVAVLGDGPDRDVRLRMTPRPRDVPDVPERRLGAYRSDVSGEPE